MHGRNNSYASSTMSRAGSISSRPPGSHTASVGTRSGLSRPNSALGLRKAHPSIQRPATSLDTYAEDSAGTVLPQKRKGMQSSFLSFPSSCPIGPWDSDAFGLLYDGWRKVSLVASETAPEELNGLDQSSQLVLVDSNDSEPSKLSPLFKIPSKPCSTQSVSPARTPKRTPKRPPPPQFLTKNSSVTCFDHTFDHNTDTEWNHEIRERSMDDMFRTFMDRMTQQGQDASGWKDSVEIYKSRSTFETTCADLQVL